MFYVKDVFLIHCLRIFTDPKFSHIKPSIYLRCLRTNLTQSKLYCFILVLFHWEKLVC